MEWRQIEGFDYEVSDEGSVRSLDRTILRKGVETRLRGQELALRKHSKGYRTVSLGRGYQRTVHSLVATAFIGPCPDGFEINHKDGDKTNNRVGNLEYMTHGDNQKHAIATGLAPKPPLKRGAEQHKARLDEIQVRRVRAYAQLNWPTCKIARFFGVGETTIHNILKRSTWAWLDD